MPTPSEDYKLVAGASRLVSMLRRLKPYVVDWKFTFVPKEDVAYEPGIDRQETDLDSANVISSEWSTSWNGKRHAVLLDIDYPAYLVRSSTEYHYHLYLDVPGGVSHEDYMELLDLLGRIGVVEKGYAEVSIKRGHSDLRLPWVFKGDGPKHREDEPDVNMKHIPPPEGVPALDDMPF